MTLSRDDVLDIFRSEDAILEGHFVLSSGLHSPVFLQKALVYRSPEKTARLCKALGEKLAAAGYGACDWIVGPAVGGIVPAYETARQMGGRFLWVEREEGSFRLRRGFSVEKGAKVVIVEDIVTTGLSVREAVAALREAGAEVLACGCLIDRSAGKADVGVPLIALAEYEVPAYPADALPPELAATPAIKPGSRGLS
ncbi:MAG: orotate phosphoribosyltransferase [Hyphomicrobiaceae bacterium]|nr:orotate phosphoribosyltransferase [Hyphomicrobiaceae bacterium]